MAVSVQQHAKSYTSVFSRQHSQQVFVVVSNLSNEGSSNTLVTLPFPHTPPSRGFCPRPAFASWQPLSPHASGTPERSWNGFAQVAKRTQRRPKTIEGDELHKLLEAVRARKLSDLILIVLQLFISLVSQNAQFLMKVKENILSSTKWVESAGNKSQPAAFQFQLLDLCEVIPGLKHLLKGDNYQLSSLVHLLDSSVGPAAQHVTQRVRPYRHWKVLTLFSQHIKQYIQKHWGEMEEVNDPFHTRPLGPCHFSVWNEICFFHTKEEKKNAMDY